MVLERKGRQRVRRRAPKRTNGTTPGISLLHLDCDGSPHGPGAALRTLNGMTMSALAATAIDLSNGNGIGASNA